MEEERDTAAETGNNLNEVLRQENENLARELSSRDAEIYRLKQALAGSESENARLEQSLAETKQQLDEIGKALPQAVAAYREMVIRASPGVVAELIAGGTIAEVDESLGKARLLVERVRQGMESEMANARIPAGAPVRSPLDLSGLTPREKIKYAMGNSPS
jgi:predicted RNase H-like nuclease (RuvC/YqgF family)